jgi:hypothetical protein
LKPAETLSCAMSSATRAETVSDLPTTRLTLTYGIREHREFLA